MCEACTKQVKYCSLTKGNKKKTSLNSAKIDNCTPLPSNVSYFYSSAIKYLCAKYTIFVLHRGEKTRTPLIPGEHRPPPLEEGELPQTQDAEQEEEEDVVEIGTTRGDRDVVDPERFTSESAQILIGEIMGCNLQLQNIQQQIRDVITKNNNIIDVLGRI
ncbi:hypothetical protein AB205_0073570 [Aquarana catesbeiana]|uniref:Uncharacterized protein n=1 Tax=Aquarana catesbeiana TaxID=8400 RepID=A0A2G9QEK0_AQUCT|nr:hypothetical protein AB205_0073570 [Aquarana catesbeiana]